MARSSSAKNGKNSKNTYRASGSKSSKSSSSGARHNSSASGSKKRMSRLEQRRAQQQNLIRSVMLAGLGILAIALVLVPGQSFWNVLRSWLFGTFGVVTYFVGPFLLYLAYLLASGYHVGTFIGKVLLLAVLLAGTAVIFSDFKVGDTPWQTVKMLFAWGQRKFWTGGVLGVPIGASLLAVCGRPGANIVMIIVILMGLMVFFAVTPVDVVQFISYYIQEFKARRAARAEEETAYDTQLFGHEAEEETLENLAKNIAYKVKRSRRSVALEPMNPYERRIIHSALQGDKFVSTKSEGEEPFRHVVVYLDREKAGNNRYSEHRYSDNNRYSR